MVLGVAGGIVALAVALTQTRAAAVVALTVFLTAGVALAAHRTWQARSLGRPRYPRGRWVAVGGLTVLLLGLSAMVVVPSWRQFTIRYALGVKTTGNSVSVPDLLVAEGSQAYELTVVVWNGTADEVLADLVELTVKFENSTVNGWTVNGCSGNGYRYRLNDSIRVAAAPGKPKSKVVGLVERIDDDGVGSFSPATGEISGYCMAGRLLLRLPVGIKLRSKEHTDIVLEIPKAFRLTECGIAWGCAEGDDRPVQVLLASDDAPVSNRFGGTADYAVGLRLRTSGRIVTAARTVTVTYVPYSRSPVPAAS